jgi:hypothetical protein
MPIEAKDLVARRQVLGLFEERGDAIVVVDLEHAEAAGFLRGNLQHRQRRAGAVILVEPQHLRVVHLVDVVAGQDDQVLRVLAEDSSRGSDRPRRPCPDTTARRSASADSGSR